MSAPLKPSLSPSRSQGKEDAAGSKGKGKAVEVLSDSESSSSEVESSLLSRPKLRKVAPTSQASPFTQPQASTSKSNVIVIDDSSDEEAAVPKVESRGGLLEGTEGELQEVDQLDDQDEARRASASTSIGSISNDEKERIMRSWRQEVPLPKHASKYSWIPLPDSPELSELLKSRKAIFKLQRKAGRDETLMLRARQRIANRLSQYARQKIGMSTLGTYLTRYEVFCRDHDIPMFPVSEPILAFYYGTNAKKPKSNEATRRTKVSQLRSLLYSITDLYSSNKSFHKLQHYLGSAAALEEYIKKGFRKDDKPVSQSSSAQQLGSSLSVQPDESDQLEVGTSNAIGESIVQATRPPSSEEDGASTEQSQSRNVSQPKRQATTSQSPAPNDHNRKKSRLPSTDKRNPTPSLAAVGELQSSSNPQKPLKVESPPPPAVISHPVVPVFKLPNNRSKSEKQASPIIETSKSSNPESKPSLDSSQKPTIPSPAPFTSTASDVFAHPHPRPRPRPSRVSLLAQSALSSSTVDPPVPLSIDTLRSFLSSLDASLDFLAEPLHSSGLDTFEVLSLFVAFEVDTRIRMVVLACKRAGVEVKEEHLETLEGAIDGGRETDWA